MNDSASERTDFIESMKRGMENLKNDPVDPQTGRPIKLTLSPKAYARLLKKLDEEDAARRSIQGKDPKDVS